MAKPKAPSPATEDQMRALLARYACPIPFHAVRTRFMGSIAAPVTRPLPFETVAALWGGTIPACKSLEAANELIIVLVMGLWNGLIRHREASAPFRLTPIDVPTTREGLVRLALMRREEVDGFIEGLFEAHASLDLPEPAHKALSVLRQIRSMIEGVRDVAENWTKPATPSEFAGPLDYMREFTRIAEHEIHKVVLSCSHARRQKLADLPGVKH